MAKTAWVAKKYYVGSINLLATGNTTVLDAISGKSFIATHAWLEITANTGINSVNPIVSLGNNSTPFNNVMLETTPAIGAGLNNDCQIFELPLGSVNPATYIVGRRWKKIDISSTGLTFRVSTAASGGTVSVLTARVWVMGILL